MEYLAVTTRTLDWLLAHTNYVDSFLAEVPALAKEKGLDETVLVMGALRIASGTKQPKLLVVWNVDYTTSTGAEQWAFLRLQEPYGVLSHQEVDYAKSLRRMMKVALLRGNKLKPPHKYLVRPYDDGLHTCVTGGSGAAAQHSIGFWDGEIFVNSVKRSLVLCIGPWAGKQRIPTEDNKAMLSYLGRELENAGRMISLADKISVDATRRPAMESQYFVNMHTLFSPPRVTDEAPVESIPELQAVKEDYRANVDIESLSYDDWTRADSQLTKEQRKILESDVLLRQPIRLIGPAGSGKSLLMQLLAIRQLRKAQAEQQDCRVLYLVHNAAMMHSMLSRFITLGIDGYFEAGPLQLDVRTLFDVGQNELASEDVPVIDPDAYETKSFQRTIVSDALYQVISSKPIDKEHFPILYFVRGNEDLMDVLSDLLCTEIGVAIRGHGLVDDGRKYIQSEQALSRLHGALTQDERQLAAC